MRTALVLVRNTVTHDSRVLREARTLHDLGFDVLVAGLVSPEERRTELDLDGIGVVRLLGPLQFLRRLLSLAVRPQRVRGGCAGPRGAANTCRPEENTYWGRVNSN